MKKLIKELTLLFVGIMAILSGLAMILRAELLNGVILAGIILIGIGAVAFAFFIKDAIKER